MRVALALLLLAGSLVPGKTGASFRGWTPCTEPSAEAARSAQVVIEGVIVRHTFTGRDAWGQLKPRPDRIEVRVLRVYRGWAPAFATMTVARRNFTLGERVLIFANRSTGGLSAAGRCAFWPAADIPEVLAALAPPARVYPENVRWWRERGGDSKTEVARAQARKARQSAARQEALEALDEGEVERAAALLEEIEATELVTRLVDLAARKAREAHRAGKGREARKLWLRVLMYGEHPGARAGLGALDAEAHRLLGKALPRTRTEPAVARALLGRVVQLTAPDDPLHQRARMALADLPPPPGLGR